MSGKRASGPAKQAAIGKKWTQLNRRIIGCTECPRLIVHCQEIAQTKRRAYLEEDYWGKPVPNFVSPVVDKSKGKTGTSTGRGLLIVGLAPGAHGANRTGRMFTGDRSGDWLYRALHKAGFANQASSVSCDDGLQLVDCVITAACHCAPPGNKPTTAEFANCQGYLTETIKLSQPKVILALGKLAWDATVKQLRNNLETRRLFMIPDDAKFTGKDRPPAFGHGQTWNFSSGCVLLGSYHPSQQNTFTGKLTEVMLDKVISKAARFSKR